MTVCLFRPIVKSLPRRRIATQARDKWCKRFGRFDHLIVMFLGQLSGQTSLRDLQASFNASTARYDHLGTREMQRSTLSDANATRPATVFEEILSLLLNTVTGKTNKEVQDLVRVLDSTKIGLFAKTHLAPRFRSNNSAIKLHLLHHSDSVCSVWFQITPARLRDSRVRGELPPRPGETYVFDHAYNNAAYWKVK